PILGATVRVDKNRSRRSRLAYPLVCGVIALAVAATGCASTGAVPRPFPAPNRSDAPVPTPPSPAVAATTTGYDLVGTALGLRGTPYRNGGASPAGFDCSGFTQYVFGQHGVSLPRDVQNQFAEGESVDVRDVVAGDLLFFATADPAPSHVAIAV